MRLFELIERGQLKEVLEILENEVKELDADFLRNIVIQKSRLSHYNEQKKQGTLTTEALQVALTNLSIGIYDLVNDFENQYWDINVSEQHEKLENKTFVPENLNPIKNKTYFSPIRIIINILGLVVLAFIGIIIFKIYNFTIDSKTISINQFITALPPITSKFQVGYDKSYKQAKIYIDILDDRFTWKLGDIVTGVLTYDNKIVNLEDYFSQQNYVEKINQALNVICLGNASIEEDLEIPLKNRKQEEETRAIVRAKYLEGIIKSLVKSNNFTTTTHVLNLGKCQEEAKVTSYQRTIIIVRVINKDSDVNLKEALIDALEKENDLPFKINTFSIVQDDKLELK